MQGWRRRCEVPAHRRAELCPAARRRRRIAARLARPGHLDGHRRGAPGMSRAKGGAGRRAPVPRLRRGRMEGGAFRPVQAGDQEELRLVAGRPPVARLRGAAARPHIAGTCQALVRRFQPDRSGERQSRPWPPAPDDGLRRRPRPRRIKPGARREADPRPYPLPCVRALAVVWLFAGLRSDEILRLRMGCVRWQATPDAPEAKPVCLLDVPTHKTGSDFTKPIDPAEHSDAPAGPPARPPARQGRSAFS